MFHTLDHNQILDLELHALRTQDATFAALLQAYKDLKLQIDEHVALRMTTGERHEVEVSQAAGRRG